MKFHNIGNTFVIWGSKIFTTCKLKLRSNWFFFCFKKLSQLEQLWEKHHHHHHPTHNHPVPVHASPPPTTTPPVSLLLAEQCGSLKTQGLFLWGADSGYLSPGCGCTGIPHSSSGQWRSSEGTPLQHRDTFVCRGADGHFCITAGTVTFYSSASLRQSTRGIVWSWGHVGQPPPPSPQEIWCAHSVRQV